MYVFLQPQHNGNRKKKEKFKKKLAARCEILISWHFCKDKLKNDSKNICLDNDVDCDDVLNDFLQKRNFSEVWDRRKQVCKTDRSLQKPWQHGTSGDTWRKQNLYFPWKLDLSLWTRNQCLQTWKSGLSSLVPKRSWDRQQKVEQAFHPGKKLCENVVRNLTLGYTL